jgi:hypothetical protein
MSQGVGLDDLLGGLLGGQGGSGGLKDILSGLTGEGSSTGAATSGGGNAGMVAALLPMLGSLLANGD